MKLNEEEFLILSTMYKASMMYYENLINNSNNDTVKDIFKQSIEKIEKFYNSIER